MRWDTILTAVVAALRADTQLIAALGTGTIEPLESDVKRVVPAVRYTLITDREEEVMNPVLLQVDYWAAGRAQAVIIEKRIRRVLHYPVRRTLGGLEMATLYDDSRDGSDPQPGVVHRSLDFRFEPVKKRLT